MPEAKPSRFDQLDRAIESLLTRTVPSKPRRGKAADPVVAGLLRVANDLRTLPREGFKAQLKSNLERRGKMDNAAKEAREVTSAELPPEPIPYRSIAPYIIVPRAAEFIDFLTAAFDGRERFRSGRPDAPQFLMHAEVQLGNCVIELADANEPYRAAPQAIHLYCDNADTFYQRAIDAGATSIYPVGEHVSGDRQGAVRDPFGNLWYIAMIQGWTPGPEGVPTVQPYLHLRGAERMIPFLERAFGATVQGHVPRSPEGHVLHATIQIGDTTLELDEAHGEFLPMPCHMHLHIDNSDVMYESAIRAGAESISAPENKPYGRSGGVKDPFGNSWYITSPLVEPKR